VSERIELGFLADSAEEAQAKAREWARQEPRVRLQTIASVRRVSEPHQSPRFRVVIVFNWVDPVPA
jgi:hypothetical protein